MIEYAILIVMVISAIGFAWLWLIEQKKRESEKKRFSKRRLSDDESSAEKRDCARDTHDHENCRTNGTRKRCKLIAHQARNTMGETISLSIMIMGFGRAGLDQLRLTTSTTAFDVVVMKL